MPRRSASPAVAPARLYDHLDILASSFRRSLAAANKSPRTITGYLEGVTLLVAFLREHNYPLSASQIRRGHIEAFMEDQLARWKPSTAATRYRAVRTFFKWAVSDPDIEIDRSPLEGTKPPHIPEKDVPILDELALKKLLKTCEGYKQRRSTRERVPGFDIRKFEAIRDAAIIRLIHDTGMRRQECAGLKRSDLDWENEVARVVGKFSRPRACPFGRKAAQALDRYIRYRERHPSADLPHLWLGQRGPMTDSGIYQVVRDRAALAGLGAVWPHLLRHTWANDMLENGAREGDVMVLAGWKSRSMLDRYGSAGKAKRARESHREHSPGDRL